MKVKKPIKKAENDKQQQPKPTYKNLQMGVNANDSKGLGYTKSGRTPSAGDSALYRFGFGQGLKGEKAYPNEGNVQRMGRWEGQNVKKPATPVKNKAKSGASLKPVPEDKKGNLGKLPTAVRNKMGFQKDGGKTKAKGGAKVAKKMMGGGKCKYGC